MKPFVVLYATREGQTRRIAEHIEAAIRDRGHSARLRDVRDIHEPFDLDRYDGAVLAASVHIGKHDVRAKAAADAQRMIDELLGETGWRRRRVKAILSDVVAPGTTHQAPASA
jgi:hypothetical protein